MTLNDHLKRFVRRAANQETEQATVGRRDPDSGELIVEAPGNDGYIWATTGGKDGFGGTVVLVRNFAGATPGLPVELERRFGETRVQKAIDQKLKAYNPKNANYAYNVDKHTHAVGSGNVDPVEANRFVPGLVRPFNEGGVFGLKVYIEATQYESNNTLTWFPGRDLDLTSFVPSTSGKQAWIVVGIDPVTNLPTAKADIDYTTVAIMNPSQLDGFDFEGNVPLGAVILRNAQTAINTFKDFADLRVFATSTSTAKTPNIVMVTTNYTVLGSDDTLFVNASAGDITITFQTSAAIRSAFYVKRTDTSANTVTLDGNGNTIDNESAQTLYINESVRIQSDGSNWWVM